MQFLFGFNPDRHAIQNIQFFFTSFQKEQIMKKSKKAEVPVKTITKPSIARVDEISADLLRLQEEEERLATRLAAAQTGEHIYIRMYGTAAKWYVIKDGTRTYLPKSEQKKAIRLAKLAWCQARLAEVRAEIKACEHYLKAFRGSTTHLQDLMENPGFCQLIGAASPDSEEWKKSPFQANPTHPENLQCLTSSGLKVRSKSEVLIATALEKYAIPFRYECRLDTPEGPFYPDFTIRHPKNGRLYIWEHFGMIDNNDYSEASLPKIGIYAQMGYFPNENLIMTFETKEHPFNLPEAEALIRQHFPTDIGSRRRL